MKKLAILLGLMCCSTMAIADSNLNIGVINTSVIFKAHNDFELLDSKFKKEFMEKKKSIEEDKVLIEQLEETLRSNIENKKIGKVAIKKEEQSIEDKKSLLAEKEKMLNEQMRKTSESGRVQILKDIKDNVELYAKQNGYDLILDTGSAVYLKKELDISDKVINFINSKEQK